MAKSQQRSSTLLIAATLGLLSTSPALSQESSEPRQRLGKVEFKIDCNAAAQSEFNLAMAYYHSFAMGPLLDEPLARALKADPSCGMVHWARALAMLDIPFVWPANVSAKTLADGAAALDAARTAGLRTARERDYVDALSVFFRDADKLNHRTRATALEAEMQKLAQRYPDDREAAILHALVLSANFDPADKQYTNQLRAAKQLEAIFAAVPDHPGVAHYLIHSYDYPPIAQQGVEAAKRYSTIAPGAPHAQHMPSHIFTRVGGWKESIASNRASAAADSPRTWNTLHAFDYMAYAHMQLGQPAAVRKLLEDTAKIEKHADHFAAAYAYAAMPARYALERDSWGEAARLELKPASGFPWQKYPQAQAVNAFARGLGAAMEMEVPQAKAEVARLQKLRDDATTLKINYWADQIDIQAEVVRGVIAMAEGNTQEGLDMLAKAAAREDATEKHVVTPGPILPAREILATMLLGQGRSADALREFESVLRKEPNRLRATLWAARAAERAGDAPRAKAHSVKVVELTREGDRADRPELRWARKVASGG